MSESGPQQRTDSVRFYVSIVACGCKCHHPWGLLSGVCVSPVCVQGGEENGGAEIPASAGARRFNHFIGFRVLLFPVLPRPSVQDVRRRRAEDGAEEVDRLLRGRAGGAVRGVAQRLRHDPGGRPLHGTEPPLDPIGSVLVERASRMMEACAP